MTNVRVYYFIICLNETLYSIVLVWKEKPKDRRYGLRKLELGRSFLVRNERYMNKGAIKILSGSAKE